jgi:transglycosylase-like protein
LRVLSGRLKAVFVALLAATLLIGILGPTATFASDPPGLARFMYALGQTESGGRYTARNPVSGAYGKYQIMPSSWRAWAGRYLGNPNARQTPANQEIVATAKVRALYRGLQSWRRVAYWWLTGSSRTSGWSTYATRYVARVMACYAKAAPTDVAGPPVPPAPPAPALRRYQEGSPAIAYSGAWHAASYPRYAGGAVRYATKAGAKATFTFNGSRVTWYGPVGPTRGQARVFLDGKLAGTVDLHRSSFAARSAVFTKAWAAAGRHTLSVEVVGTAGHPYVAIDEFVVGS